MYRTTTVVVAPNAVGGVSVCGICLHYIFEYYNATINGLSLSFGGIKPELRIRTAFTHVFSGAD